MTVFIETVLGGSVLIAASLLGTISPPATGIPM